MTVDRQVLARHRAGREQSARSVLPWVVLALVVGAATAGSYWLVNSTSLDVDVIEVYGARRVDPAPLLEVHGLREGAGLVWVKAGSIEDALLADPWVAQADARVVYPDTVEVSVLEYTATAWIGAGDTWYLVSPEGAVLEAAAVPRSGLPAAELDVLRHRPGDLVGDGTALAAIAFLDAVTQPATMWGDAAGLWADVGGIVVKLGRPERMAEKAAVLGALLTEGLGPALVVDLSAPERPAVRPSDPQPPVEGGADTP